MPDHADAHFPETHWTLIARIKSPDSAVAAKALNELCAQYHYPLYCYLRRRGCEHHDAQDVLHDFLVLVLRRHSLERLEESRGRLRGWLATSLGRHLGQWRASQARREQPAAMTPEGGQSDRGLDFEAIEARYQRDRFRDSDTPDRVFERKWAREMLRQAIDKLAAQYERRGRGVQFTVLRPVLEAGGSLRGEDAPALAARLGLNEGTVRTLFHRLLEEFREEMQAAVRLTVESADEVPGELAYLMGLFRR